METIQKAAWMAAMSLLIISQTARIALSATVAFGPMPAIPTIEECRQMQISDDAVIREFLISSESQEQSEYGDIVDGSRLRRQAQHISDGQTMGHEATERFIQCSRAAAAAQDAGRTSVTGQTVSAFSSAWMSGIGSLPDGVFSPGTAGVLISFTQIAAKAMNREQRLESSNLRIQSAQDLVSFWMTGEPPPGDAQTKLWQGVGLTNDLLSQASPPWSVFATTLAVSAIHSIAYDSMAQLDQAVARFDAIAIADGLGNSVDTISWNYLGRSSLPIDDSSHDGSFDALNSLDDTVKQIAALAIDVANQNASEKAAQAKASADAARARRLPEEQARRRPVAAPPPPASPTPSVQSYGASPSGREDMGPRLRCLQNWIATSNRNPQTLADITRPDC